MLAASVRARVSVEPPAGAPTRMRTGTLPICACAPPPSAAAMDEIRMSLRFTMSMPLYEWMSYCGSKAEIGAAQFVAAQ